MRDKAKHILNEGAMIPAIPLALDKNRKFDEKKQRTLIRYYLDAGAGGIAVGVHTTQFKIRDPGIDLFHVVVETVLDEIGRFEQKNGKTIVKIAGVCGKTEQALSEARFAAKKGADAVLLSPGGLMDLSEDEMIERTAAVACVTGVIGFYLQPAAGGRIFSAGYWKRLSDIEGVAAIKCAPFDRYRTTELARGVACSKRCGEIALYTGNDDNILADLLTTYEFEIDGKKVEKRFAGGLLGHWAVWTKTAADIFERVRQCRTRGHIPADLLKLGIKITDANSAFFDAANGYAGCIPGIHEVLRRQGIFEGVWCLDPSETLSVGQYEEIDRVYREYPELNDDDFVRSNLHKWL